MRLTRPLRREDKLRIASEIIVTHVRVRRRISSLPLPELLTHLRCGVVDCGVHAAQTADDHLTAVRLGRATLRALRWLPGDTRCLTQSLVLTSLLARRGIGSRLVIAVSPGESFTAHAWVEHGGLPVLPADKPGFGELATL